MLIEAKSIADGEIVDTDICIIGAGPAGITFAREWIGSQARVTLLESGLFEYDEQTQKLGEGELESEYFVDNSISDGRRRQFGGTANLWTYTTEPGDGRRYARSLPPEPIDLAPREGQPSFGWPLSMDDLDSFYKRAQYVWNGAAFDYNLGTWAAPDTPPLDLGDVLTTKICQHGPADVFALGYRDDLLSAENVDVYLGCTALAFETGERDGRAQRLQVARAGGESFSVDAQIYVMAGGGVENVQMLLLSDMTRPGAIGNQHDMLGRYVTIHPEFRMGFLVPSKRDLLDDISLYDIRWVGRHMVSGFLTIADEVKQSENLLNMSVAMTPRGPGYGTDAHRAIASIGAARRGREKPHELGANLRSIVRSPRDSAEHWRTRSKKEFAYYDEFRGGWSNRDAEQEDFRLVELWGAPEQTAESDMRYTLLDERDRLGRRRVKLDWRWSQSDLANIDRSISIFSSQIAESGLGTFRRWVEFEGPNRPMQFGVHHPMGGTRMHTDPRLGVVDENCLVHGLNNVYVASSSVFPTGLGYANPTLTILALTLRLADHVKSTLGGSG